MNIFKKSTLLIVACVALSHCAGGLEVQLPETSSNASQVIEESSNDFSNLKYRYRHGFTLPADAFNLDFDFNFDQLSLNGTVGNADQSVSCTINYTLSEQENAVFQAALTQLFFVVADHEYVIADSPRRYIILDDATGIEYDLKVLAHEYTTQAIGGNSGCQLESALQEVFAQAMYESSCLNVPLWVMPNTCN